MTVDHSDCYDNNTRSLRTDNDQDGNHEAAELQDLSRGAVGGGGVLGLGGGICWLLRGSVSRLGGSVSWLRLSVGWLRGAVPGRGQREINMCLPPC